MPYTRFRQLLSLGLVLHTDPGGGAEVVCPTGHYGRDCENRCNCTKDGGNCFVSTEASPSGCAVGYQVKLCQNLRPTGNLFVIVGTVCAFLVLITTIAVGVFICRRRRNHNKDDDTIPHKLEQSAKPPVMRKANNIQVSLGIQQHRINVGYFNVVPRLSEMSTFCSSHISVAEDRKKSQKQFKAVPTISSAATVAATSSEHHYNDRITYITPYDGCDISLSSTALSLLRELKAKKFRKYTDATLPRPNERMDDTFIDDHDYISII